MSMLTIVNGATGTLRISATVMMPRLALLARARQLLAQPALQRPSADQAADAVGRARAEHRADRRADEAERGPSVSTVARSSRGSETRRGCRARTPASTSGTPTGCPQRRDAGADACATAHANGRLPEAEHASSTTANGAEQRERPTSRPRIAKARGLRDENVGRHDALGIAELHDEVDPGRIVALDRADAAVGGRARRAAPRLEPRVPRAVRRAEDGHARQRLRARRRRARPRRALRRRVSSRPSAPRSTGCARRNRACWWACSLLRSRCRTPCRSPSSDCSSSTSRCEETRRRRRALSRAR